MTLEETPPEIKELIIHQVIEQSDNTQQARNTLAACAGISRRWGFLRADLQRARQYTQAQDKTEVEQDGISRLLREKAKQDLIRYLQNIERITDGQFWQKMSATPGVHPKICVQNFMHNIFSHDDITTILTILIIPLVNGELPLDCVDILFEYYNINPSYKHNCYKASQALMRKYIHCIHQYPDDIIKSKVRRIRTIIEKLKQYDTYDSIIMLPNTNILRTPPHAQCPQEYIEYLKEIIYSDDDALNPNACYETIHKQIRPGRYVFIGGIVACITFLTVCIYTIEANRPLYGELFVGKILAYARLKGTLMGILAGPLTGIATGKILYKARLFIESERYKKSDEYKCGQILRARGL